MPSAYDVRRARALGIPVEQLYARQAQQGVPGGGTQSFTPAQIAAGAYRIGSSGGFDVPSMSGSGESAGVSAGGLFGHGNEMSAMGTRGTAGQSELALRDLFQRVLGSSGGSNAANALGGILGEPGAPGTSLGVNTTAQFAQGNVPQPIQDAFQTQLNRNLAEITESFGRGGARFGTDLATRLGRTANDATTQFTADNAERSLTAAGFLDQLRLNAFKTLLETGLGPAEFSFRRDENALGRDANLAVADSNRELGLLELATRLGFS